MKRRIWGLSTTEWLALGILGIFTYAAWSIWGRPILTFAYYRSTSISNARSALESDDALVRQAAARGLGKRGKPASSSIPDLLLAMQDESSAVASSSAWAIGHILCSKPNCSKALLDEISASLTEALSHQSSKVRRYAAYALSLNPTIAKDAIPQLTALLRDPRVAYVAVRTLGEIGQEARESTLEVAALLVGASPGDRAEAAVALSRLQPLPKNTIVAIEKLLDDEVDFVRVAAQKALNVIDTSAK